MDAAVVSDVGGMSGSVVYGAKAFDGMLKYWLLGIESSWFAPRTVKVYPSICFLTTLKVAIRRLGERRAPTVGDG